MSYAILTDAACDLDAGIVRQGNLSFIPMEYSLGDSMRSCVPPEDAETMKLFYDGQRNGALTKTTQISPMQYGEAFVPWLEKGCSVLYLSLSGGLSSTSQTAAMTAKKLEGRYPGLRIIVVDTKAATGGMGILCERALRNREKGMSLEANAEDLQEAIKHLYHWFLVQDLMYLQRGGRIGAATAAVGTIFQIRPILKIDTDGRLQTIGKARGNHKAVKELLDHYAECASENTEDPVYVIDADAPETAAELQQKLLEAHPNLTIRRCTLSPIIGAHTGPGMAAIVHIGK